MHSRRPPPTAPQERGKSLHEKDLPMCAVWSLRSWEFVQAKRLTWRSIFTRLGLSVDFSGVPDSLIDCVPEKPTELMPPGLCFDATRGLWVYRQESNDIVLRRREETDVFETHMSWMDAEQATDVEKRATMWAMELQRMRHEVRVLEAQNAHSERQRAGQLPQGRPTTMRVKAEVKDENHAADLEPPPFFSPPNIGQAFSPPVKAEKSNENHATVMRASPLSLSPFHCHRETMPVKAEIGSKHHATAWNSTRHLLSAVGISQPTVQELPFVLHLGRGVLTFNGLGSAVVSSQRNDGGERNVVVQGINMDISWVPNLSE